MRVQNRLCSTRPMVMVTPMSASIIMVAMGAHGFDTRTRSINASMDMYDRKYVMCCAMNMVAHEPLGFKKCVFNLKNAAAQ